MSTPLDRMADFDLTDEQRQVRSTVKEFAEKEILPHVEQYEQEEKYPLDLVAKLVPMGLMGPMIPEEYGGSFSDVVTYGIICEELARVDWVVASVVSVSNSLVAGSILKFGSDAQKEQWLPAIAKGEAICSACLTEPGGGTDLGNMKTTATKVDGGYRLNGTKVFISHAEHAGLFFVVASVDISKKHKGVTAFLIDPRATEGIGISDFPMRTLKRDNLAEVSFVDAFVPDSCLLGEPGRGFPVLGSALDTGRFSVAARCVGQSQRCIDLAVPYAMEREAFGEKIGGFQMIQQKIADMNVPHAAGAPRRLPAGADEGRRHRALLDRIVDGEAASQQGGHTERARRNADLRRLLVHRGVRDRAPLDGSEEPGVRRRDERAPHEDHRRDDARHP